MFFLWLDLETTGLDPETCEILEVGAVITDDRGTILHAFDSPLPFNFHPEIHKDLIHPVVIKMHTENGLFEACRTVESSSVVWTQLLTMLEINGIPPHQLTLAGNSVHFDRRFLEESDFGRAVLKHVNHRHLDMSSVMLHADTIGIPRPPKNWKVFTYVDVNMTHRAREDIAESLSIFHYYREQMAKTGAEYGDGGGI